MPTTKPKQKLCCMMRPLGECRYCHKVVCNNHGAAISYTTYKVAGAYLPLSIQCKSTKCNDSIHKVKIDLARRREVRRARLEAMGLTPATVNSKGKALLERISSQKAHKSLSKISQRKGRKH